MLGLSKRNQNEAELPVPYILPEHVEGKIRVFEQLTGNYPPNCNQHYLQELVDCIPIAEQKGLSKQAGILKRRAIAGLLEMRGMALIFSERRYSGGDYLMSRFGCDGKTKYIHPTEKREDYTLIKLRDFESALPTELIKNIPQEMVGDVKVLFTKNDPIA